MSIHPEQVQPFVFETGSDPTPADDDSMGFGIGARWRNTSTSQIWVKAGEPAPGNAIWRRDSFDPPAEETPTFDAYDLAGTQQKTDGTWTTFLWDTEEVNTGQFSLVGGVITVNYTGKIKLSYNISVFQFAGNSRTTWGTRVLKNGLPVPGSVLVPEYTRNNANGEGASGTSRAFDVTSGDQFTIEWQIEDGAGDIQAIASASHISIHAIQGAKGDKGDPGSGSSVSVENAGVPVAGSPFPTFNFVGAGVTASPGAPGVVDITIPGNTSPVNAYGEEEGEFSRTATSFVQVFRVNFSTFNPNTIIDIDWQCEVKSTDEAVPCNVRIEVNDIANSIADVGMHCEENTGDPNQSRTQMSGFRRFTVAAAGANFADFDFASGESGKQVFIRRMRLRVTEVV